LTFAELQNPFFLKMICGHLNRIHHNASLQAQVLKLKGADYKTFIHEHLTDPKTSHIDKFEKKLEHLRKVLSE